MKSILVGIPSSRNNLAFWDSMANFLPEMNKKYRMEVIQVGGKKIDEARNTIVDFFLSKDYEYLLFLDDDHSGHTIEMVEALLKPDEMVCAMKCYSRYFPYLPNLLDYSGIQYPYMKYQQKDVDKGYHYCDLVGFGMTLIKKEVFSYLQKPYFVAENNAHEDNYFSDNIHFIGIRPMGCFDFVCTHNGIDDSNVKELADKEMVTLLQQIKKDYPDYQNKKIIIAV